MYNLLTSRWLQCELKYAYPRFELARPCTSYKDLPIHGIGRWYTSYQTSWTAACTGHSQQVSAILIHQVAYCVLYISASCIYLVIKVPHSICKPSTNTRLTKVILTQEWEAARPGSRLQGQLARRFGAFDSPAAKVKTWIRGFP